MAKKPVRIKGLVYFLLNISLVSLLASLMPLLSGRIWTGKEYLLNAVGAVFTYAGTSLGQFWTDKDFSEVDI